MNVNDNQATRAAVPEADVSLSPEIGRWTGVLIGAGLVGVLLQAPAQAAPSHFNTDPYTTGCANNSFTLSSKSVSGGTASIKVSRSCGTNWLEYSGAKQTTTKRGMDGSTNQWTDTEVDNAARSWSMQSNAPGTTPFTATIKIGSTTVTAKCSTNCSWTSSSTPSTSTLSQKVDAFVTKYNGKYVDYDGYYGAQCVDLSNFWVRDVIKARVPSVSYAYQLYDNYDSSKFTRVSASSAPKKGDLVIWNRGGVYGSTGHVALLLGTSGSNLKVLTQNPGATKIAYISKTNLRGYLRPR